ncbi:MAG: hypothetical protein WBA57_22350 [Elainellaceae cyanobacterium]
MGLEPVSKAFDQGKSSSLNDALYGVVAIANVVSHPLFKAAFSCHAK